jgi:uncharacterized membrane protein
MAEESPKSQIPDKMVRVSKLIVWVPSLHPRQFQDRNDEDDAVAARALLASG